MAVENLIGCWTFIAGADLSDSQFRFVKVDANGNIVLAGAGEAAIGVLQDKPASGRAGLVGLFGITKVMAGGAIAKGALVASGANGKAVAATTAYTNTADAGVAEDPLVGSHVMGVALESAAADGNIITIALIPLGAVPRTAV